MRFMVTGCEGYIGKHLVTELGRRYPHAYIKHIDIDDECDGVEDEIFDCVFHLAAHSNIDVCNLNKFTTFNENIGITGWLLEDISKGKLNVRNFVFASSAAVYNPNASGVYVESDELVSIEDVNNSYGLSKVVCENLLGKARKEFGLKYVALRLSNVSGEVPPCRENHQPETHLIPRLLYWDNDKDGNFPVYGSAEQVRDYIHVGDVVDAMIKSYETMSNTGPEIWGAINISSGIGHSIEEIIELVNRRRNLSSLGMIKYEIVNPRQGDSSKLVLDNTLANDVLKWSSKHDIGSIINSYR